MEPEDDENLISGVEQGMERMTLAATNDAESAGTRSKALPQFSFRSFVEDVDRQKRIEEETRRVGAEERKERSEMWTTPGQRPLAEPPIMDWDYIFRRNLKSDAQYAALFPGKPDKVSKQKDLDFEAEALMQYQSWAMLMAEDLDTLPSRRRFYETLGGDILEEMREPATEGHAHYCEADRLGQFEYEFLDEKGGTSRMEKLLQSGSDPFYYHGPSAREKYGYLMPHDFKINMLATWETRWVVNAWELYRITNALQKGWDIFLNGHPEIRNKYAYLIPPDYEFRKWLRRHLRTEERMRRLQEWIARGADIFLFSDSPNSTLNTTWPQLIPDDFMMDPVATFELYWLAKETTLKIEWHLERGWDVFRGWGEAVEEKYGHLRSHLLPRDDYANLSSTESGLNKSDGGEDSYLSEDDQQGSDSMVRLNGQHRDQASTDSDGNISDESEGPYHSVNDQARSESLMRLSDQHTDARSADSESNKTDGSGASHHSEDDQPDLHDENDDEGEEETSSSSGNSPEGDQEESSHGHYSDGQETTLRSGDNSSESESTWDGSDTEEHMMEDEQLLRSVIWWDERARTSRFWFRDRLRAKYRYL